MGVILFPQITLTDCMPDFTTLSKEKSRILDIYCTSPPPDMEEVGFHTSQTTFYLEDIEKSGVSAIMTPPIVW